MVIEALSTMPHSCYYAAHALKGRCDMKIVDDHIEVTDQEATSAVKGHNVRYVLLISLIAAVVVLSIIWITGALTH